MRLAITCGALSGFIAVILSAWAAHGLGDIVSAEDLERIKIGTELQLWHALALLAVGASASLMIAANSCALGLSAGSLMKRPCFL